MNQREIAKLAGVSVATVSRVINDSDSVTEKTKKLVRKVIEENAYVQNINARNLRTAKSNVIGFLISYFGNPFFIELFEGLESACNKLGFSIIVGNTNEDEEQERKAIDQFLSYRVSGIVASFANPTRSVIDKLDNYNAKVVMLDRLVNGLDGDSVVIDNIHGAIEQVNYLVRLGHRRIAVIHGTLSNSNGVQRMEGFHKGMMHNAIDVCADYIKNGQFLEETAYSATVELMNLPQPPTAIVTHNNLMTIGAFSALKDMHLNIPEDVSLVGFDPFALSDYLEPKITYIDRPIFAMGELAGRMIVERIKEEYTGKARGVVFPVKLHLGESCAPPKN